MTDLSIVPDPGLFYPQVMMGVRDSDVWPLYGQTKMSGALTGPLFPVNGIHMWIGAVGSDNSQSGTVDTPVGTGTIPATAAAATSAVYTITGASQAPAALGGEFYQIGPGLACAGTSSAATATTLVDAASTTLASTDVGRVVSALNSTGAVTKLTVTSATGTTWTGTGGWSNGTAVAVGAYSLSGGAAVNGATTQPGSQIVLSTSYSGGTLNFGALALKVATIANGGAGLVIQRVKAPFYHNVVPSNAFLNSYTIEKNLANYQSEQYAGVRVDKFSLKLPTSNAEASFTADLIAKGVEILDSPTAITVDTAAPYVFTEGAVNFNGKALVQATNIEFTIENTVKDTYSIVNSTLPTFLTPTTRKITGKLTMIWVSNDDDDWGYFKKMIPSLATNGTPFQADLNLTLTHPLGAGSFYVDFPQVNFAKVGDEIKIGDVIMQTFDFTAAYSIAAGTVMSSYVANSQPSAY